MPGPVFFDGERVSLRTIEEDDLPFLHEHVNDPSVWRAIGRSRPVNGEAEREFFEEVVCGDGSVDLLIAAEEEPIGTVGLDLGDRAAGTAELGYWVAPDHRREGYGTEATELVVAYGFDQLGLHRIAARVFEFNEASIRLLERVGFTHEGVHRDDEFVDGAYRDTHWYGLLEDEWRSDQDG